jgi:hypothetical protein
LGQANLDPGRRRQAGESIWMRRILVRVFFVGLIASVAWLVCEVWVRAGREEGESSLAMERVKCRNCPVLDKNLPSRLILPHPFLGLFSGSG